MAVDDLAARKQALRRETHRSPRPDRAGLAEAALRRLLELPELATARTVALYAAIQDEVPVYAAIDALRARGCRTVAPRVAGSDLELLEVPGGGWRLGYRGIPEPAAGGPQVPAAEVDVFVVPGLLFDRALRRLGRGGGHYDRLLALAAPDACRVGICYADRVVEVLPAAAWDVSMHVVVTERAVMRPSGVEGA